jgi:hypothetical protein
MAKFIAFAVDMSGTPEARYDLIADELRLPHKKRGNIWSGTGSLRFGLTTIGASRGSSRPRSSPECQQKQDQVRCRFGMPP